MPAQALVSAAVASGAAFGGPFGVAAAFFIAGAFDAYLIGAIFIYVPKFLGFEDYTITMHNKIYIIGL